MVKVDKKFWKGLMYGLPLSLGLWILIAVMIAGMIQ